MNWLMTYLMTDFTLSAQANTEGEQFIWSEKCQVAFDNLKEKLVQACTVLHGLP